MLAIKDMAGLLKPYAAEALIAALKEAVTLPIHLHTHDTSALQPATYLKAVEAGVDVLDVAIASMSGTTSQPNFNSVLAMLQGHPRELPYDLAGLNSLSDYWEVVRSYYAPFEAGLKAGTATVFAHEMPGGQYSNLKAQAQSLGVADKFELVIQNYQAANRLFGNIPKVTPSSKVVGDLALFMTANGLSEEDVLAKGAQIAFPESVKDFFRGELGQPVGGFPPQLQAMVLKGEKPYTERPNAYLKAIDFEQEFATFQEKFDKDCSFLDFLSYQMYPKVFEEYYQHRQEYGQVDYIPTKAFFYGMRFGEEIQINISEGKTLLVRKRSTSQADENGLITVSFELNGQYRRVRVRDQHLKIEKASHQKAESPLQIGAPLQGKIAEIKVQEGQSVEANTPLFVIEAMKMESIITANEKATVKKIHLPAGTLVEQGDLVVELE
jgi:pyruvate carboxylase